MAADTDTTGFLGNIAGIAAVVGGLFMTVWAIGRSLLTSQRDAREAKESSKAHDKEIQELKEWRRERDERDRNIALALERIEEALVGLQRPGGRRG